MNAKPITADEIMLVASATAFETLNQLDKRNEQAAKLFADRKNRKLLLNDGTIVWTTWDKRSRNWATCRLDKDGCTMPLNAGRWDVETHHEYTGEPCGASIMHMWTLARALGLRE